MKCCIGKHYPIREFIVTPSEMVEILEEIKKKKEK